MVIYLLIIFIVIIHYVFTNIYEKALFQLQFNNSQKTQRPQLSCEKKTQLNCQGMPSGHAEIVTIVSILLYKYYLLNPFILSIIIVIVSLQRIIYKKHTVFQILIGLIFGTIYGLIYNDKLIIYICWIFPLIYVLIIVSILENKLREKTPSWIKPDLYSILAKKIDNISLFDKMKCVLILSIASDYSLYCSWNELEKHLDKLILMLGNTSNYDIVIGIKSGGAIISNYISMKLNLPNYYMKIAMTCEKTFNESVYEFLGKYIFKNKIKKYLVCENVPVDVTNKNILLVDESVGSGNTIKTCKKYLLEKGAKNVTLACIENMGISNIDELIIASNDHYIVWPWGYDN